MRRSTCGASANPPTRITCRRPIRPAKVHAPRWRGRSRRRACRPTTSTTSTRTVRARASTIVRGPRGFVAVWPAGSGRVDQGLHRSPAGRGGRDRGDFSIVAVEQGWNPRSVGADPVDTDLGLHVPTAGWTPPAATCSATRSRSEETTSACCSGGFHIEPARAGSRGRAVDAGLPQPSELGGGRSRRGRGRAERRRAGEDAPAQQPDGQHGDRRGRPGQRAGGHPLRACVSSSAPRSGSWRRWWRCSRSARATACCRRCVSRTACTTARPASSRSRTRTRARRRRWPPATTRSRWCSSRR